MGSIHNSLPSPPKYVTIFLSLVIGGNTHLLTSAHTLLIIASIPRVCDVGRSEDGFSRCSTGCDIGRWCTSGYT